MKNKRFLKIANSAQLGLMMSALVILGLGIYVSLDLSEYSKTAVYIIILGGVIFGIAHLINERKEIDNDKNNSN